MDKIAIFSFFAGAGFLDLGFELTNHFKTVYVNEYHKPFNNIYKHSRKLMNIDEPEFGHHIEDISLLLSKKKLSTLKNEVEIARNKYGFVGFIGGPPCPDFSVAGKNMGREGENGKLSGTYATIICDVQPDFFLFENVKGLYRTAKHREFFEHLKTTFKLAGYSLTEQLINSLEFGAPQDRERIILIGFHKKALKEMNKKIKNGNLVDFDWEKNKKYNRADILKMQWPQRDQYIENGIINKPENIIDELTVNYWFEKNDVKHHPNMNLYFKPKAGLIRFQTIDEGDDKKKCFKRLHRWRYSPTAAYGNNEVHIHPFLPRRISVAEALAIQSLPLEYELPTDETLTNAFKSIGNGVPYLAAKGIAENIYDYINQ